MGCDYLQSIIFNPQSVIRIKVGVIIISNDRLGFSGEAIADIFRSFMPYIVKHTIFTKRGRCATVDTSPFLYFLRCGRLYYSAAGASVAASPSC